MENMNQSLADVSAWKEKVIIPTYRTGQPDKNPMFLEKRIYQGSSGAVYPHPVIDKVSDHKEDKEYLAVFLENAYLKIMILPELGGRIQMAYDKTNDYHFVYYNRVIKPALVGLTGPWISGGIEFNWPQHHRPSTFESLDYTIEAHPDGSKTVWVGEIEKMFHTKGMAGFTLYPGKAYVEITGKLYNRTPLSQTFLWWANPAVAVDEHYQSVFPPDVYAVFDHGKRDVSSFPVATGTYYKVDYSPGTDISRYKNIPVPTSYMANHSEFDFMGGYHHGKKAGILHIANHHVSPGKKQWTWGNGEFGQAWDRQLTDEDGPYFELMTGVFTDNQPDFGWIMPNEAREFKQYFMPYKHIGYVKNATKEAAVNLEIVAGHAWVRVYLTSAQSGVAIYLLKGQQVLWQETTDGSPSQPFEKSIALPDETPPQQLCVVVKDHHGRELVRYQPVHGQQEAIPEPAKPMEEPHSLATTEALYLAGLHLEQYRHATYSPVPYYEEALRRAPEDVRNNNALGGWYLRRGQFSKAEPFFRRAVETLTRHNPNPYDGEPLYNLGMTLLYQQRPDEAYSFFFKATWNAAWQDNAYLQLARLDTQRGNYSLALELSTYCLQRNYHGFQARHLKAALLRKLNCLDEAQALARETLVIDPLEFGASYEFYLTLLAKQEGPEAAQWLRTLQERLRDNAHTYLEMAVDYLRAGLYAEAIALLNQLPSLDTHPLPLYYLAYLYDKTGTTSQATDAARRGFACLPDRVFPNRLEDIAVLTTVQKLNPQDYKAAYYLGNLWYDKRQYAEAIEAWETSRQLFDGFPTVHRNLGIAYYNRFREGQKALACFEKAFALNPNDARVLFELDQLCKRLNQPVEERLSRLKQYPHLVNDRDDLYIEYVTLHNLTRQADEAARLLAARTFHPWEGGEGKVSGQYTQTQVELAKTAMSAKKFEYALALLQAAQTYPLNLGEGKLYGTLENDIHYWRGCVYEALNDLTQPQHAWQMATLGPSEPTQAIFYNDPQPDKLFYQGLALQKLGRHPEARTRFEALLAYGETHRNDQVKIDFFAVSLPDLMIFDDDLNIRNRLHCHYLMGLGHLGLGNAAQASEEFAEVLRLDAAHLGAVVHQLLLPN